MIYETIEIFRNAKTDQIDPKTNLAQKIAEEKGRESYIKVSHEFTWDLFEAANQTLGRNKGTLFTLKIHEHQPIMIEEKALLIPD